ncbi:ABC transporter ATP-binding protein [Stratiformator vulcanicus]|uniref:Putative ABC transporter ATP-binding protein YxlF n=1 Tax=Stratiformator vulcanicus TaxID=2527980 RepID=A0A517R3R4_9PLAN|nr:ATP-binding cassette domain-containing protein [Stratiformator vulcanicus]QDT38514.1 putative ABC transporter ATP-binding protein YxlF [Stratiformator vulcanicus]
MQEADATSETGGDAGTPMISANGLSKFYGSFVAARNVSFSVPQGQVAAFLGPNGAGKSTTMKMLTGFLAPSEGSASIGGFDVAHHRIEAARTLGYLPESGPLYAEMTPNGLLRYAGTARGLSGGTLSSRLDFVIETCSLGSVWRKPISKLSRGFCQRVGMAQALIHDPEVLILDEPTGGLDPNQVHGVRDLVHQLRETKTVLLSTHILREVQAMCDRVILINKGEIVFDGAVAEMGTTDAEMESRFRELTVGEPAMSA